MKGYRFPFEAQEEWRACLEQQGFVVIANWLSSEECEGYVSRFWSIMEHLSEGRLDRNDPSTQILSKNYPPVLHGGMIQYVGHSQAQWDLRKSVKKLFAKIWGTEELCTSFDGFCFMNGLRRYQKVPLDSFLHCDQSPRRDFLWSYQGVMCLTNSGENEGGFVCVPGSHKRHHDYFLSKGIGNHKADWFLVPSQDKEQRVLGECLKVNSMAGDFILFDSRTFHANTVPIVPALRVCTYICMLPAHKKRGDRTIPVKGRRVSNHHPGDGFKLFPTLPRFVNDRDHFLQVVEKVNNFKMDEQIQALI